MLMVGCADWFPSSIGFDGYLLAWENSDAEDLFDSDLQGAFVAEDS